MSTLVWLRRGEIGAGLLYIAFAAWLWDREVLRWVLLALALVCLMPGTGFSLMLRRARSDPEFLKTKPAPDQSRRSIARMRRFLIVLLPICVFACWGFGYVVEGWTMGIFMGVTSLLMLSFAVWHFERWRSRRLRMLDA